MMKRNDGYALAYVMVVLFVLASVALATMSLALVPAKNQEASLRRMQDKYAAQGMVEQIVAQLEHADEAEDIQKVLDAYQDNTADVYCTSATDNGVVTYTIIASSGKTTVTVEFILEPVQVKIETQPPETDDSTEGSTDGETEDPSETPQEPVKKTIGYTVKYRTYTVAVETEAAP